MMMPPFDFSSPSRRLTTTRSCKGWNAMSFPSCSRPPGSPNSTDPRGNRMREKGSLALIYIECQQTGGEVKAPFVLVKSPTGLRLRLGDEDRQDLHGVMRSLDRR